jgi:formamidase
LGVKLSSFGSFNYSILCIPGVRFPGLTHPGVVGTAPSVELLNIWNEREKRLAETNQETLKLCEVLHQRPLVHLPTPENSLLGKAWSNFSL